AEQKRCRSPKRRPAINCFSITSDGDYLKTALLFWKLAMRADRVRRDSPHICAQRPTCPLLCSKALRMYCCSTSEQTSRSKSGSGRLRSIAKGNFGGAGFVNSEGKFSSWMAPFVLVTQARSMAFSNSRILPGQEYLSSASIACGESCLADSPARVYFWAK